MKNFRALAVSSAILIGVAGCADLDVQNLNAPDADRALAQPGDVESLIGGSFRTWWISQKTYDGAGLALSTTAWEHSSSHGNRRMWLASRVPREAVPSHPASGEPMVIETTWYNSYRAISGVNDGLRAVQAGTVTLPGGQSGRARAEAWGRLVQGLAHGTIALLYDQGFVADETTDPGAEPELVPYSQVMDAALGYLDDAIELAENNVFDIPSTWINGLSLTDSDVARIAHSYKARFLARVARTPAERAAVDWDQVIYHADRGVTSTFAPISNWSTWWDEIQVYGTFTNWAQMSYYHFGKADISGGYQNWWAQDWEDRTRFVMETPDQRWPQGSTGAEQAENPGMYFEYYTLQPFQVARGTYYMSYYRDHRFDSYLAAGYTGPMTEIQPAEMWLLMAEGHIHNGNHAAAAELINRTRVDHGGLPPVTGAGTVPGGDQCVPRLPDGSCGDLMDALKWEKRNEARFTGFGGFYFDDRGWGDLVSGTALHWPVPGKELEVLQLPMYTFGGGTNPEWEAP